MKTPDFKVLNSIIISFLTAVSALACALILDSKGFVNSKYGIVLLAVTAVGYVSYLILSSAEKHIERKYSGKIGEEKQLRKEYEQEAIDAILENEKLKKELELIKAEPKSDTEYKQKYEAIRDYRDSFPFVINKTLKVYSIIRTELVTGAYSRWNILGETNGELFACSVLRADVQTYKEMLMLVKGTDSIDEIASLDKCKELICD